VSTDKPPDRAQADPPCKEVVELITDYLDGALPDDLRARVDAHLEHCEGCQHVLDQFRTVVSLTGRLTEADVDNTDDFTRDRLNWIFRTSRRR
jgi:anti-sigma factor RsiW